MTWRQGLTGALRTLLGNIVGDKKLCSQWPSLSPQELRRYAGVYENPLTGEKIDISYNSGKLFRRRNGQTVALNTFTSNRFVMADGRGIHNFVWKGNHVIGLALQSGFYRLK